MVTLGPDLELRIRRGSFRGQPLGLCLILSVLLSLCACQFTPAKSKDKHAASASASDPQSGGTPAAAQVWADQVIAYTPVTVPGWPFSSDLTLAVGTPGGPNDVLRLGYKGNAAVRFGDGSTQYCIVDGDGADFVVYSSAVPVTDPIDGPGTFSQVMTVEVSLDAFTWYSFPYKTLLAYPLVNPAHYHDLSGVTPTVGTGAGTSGGDAFDLADLAETTAFGGEVCYVRVTDAWGAVPDYGDTQPDPWQGGAGLDTIQVLNSSPAPATSP